MHLDGKAIGVIAVGAAAIMVLVYNARSQTNNGQSRYETASGGEAPSGLNVYAIDALDTGLHYFHPAYCVPGQTQIFTQHKYPIVSGGNVSTLIHHGMDALRRPAPQDDDWRTRPPAEVMW
jgi:hypothetical protein